MEMLIAIPAFIVAVGVLVTVHEFGHYWVARKLGVKVLRFSVGFGKPLWMRKAGADQTEYVIAALPLGGYVRMLDEREGDVDPADAPRAFNRKPVLSRIAIVAAGPAFNFLFAVVAYWLMFVVGVSGIKPYVDEPVARSAVYEAGIRAGDLIVAVEDIETPDWATARMALLEHALDQHEIRLSVLGEDGQLREQMLPLGAEPVLKQEGDFVEHLGFVPWRPSTPVFVEIKEGGAAERAGMRAGDRIVGANGRDGITAQQLFDLIKTSPEQSLVLRVEREGARVDVTLVPERRVEDGEARGFVNAVIGAEISEETRQKLATTVTYGPFAAVPKAIEEMGRISLLTLRLMGKLVTGEASLKNISGPITIAEFAGVSALIGLAAFLSFLGMVSISLGIINLLPVPVLDGGHLLYYLIELVKGSPLSEAAQDLGQRVGLALLAGLMMLAIYNDITRLFS